MSWYSTVAARSMGLCIQNTKTGRSLPEHCFVHCGACYGIGLPAPVVSVEQHLVQELLMEVVTQIAVMRRQRIVLALDVVAPRWCS